MPAAKLRPVGPKTIQRPPVIYSHPWSPTPSTTAIAPLLRTQKRSAAWPQKKASPLVAPYKQTFPIRRGHGVQRLLQVASTCGIKEFENCQPQMANKLLRKCDNGNLSTSTSVWNQRWEERHILSNNTKTTLTAVSNSHPGLFPTMTFSEETKLEWYSAG